MRRLKAFFGMYEKRLKREEETKRLEERRDEYKRLCKEKKDREKNNNSDK